MEDGRIKQIVVTEPGSGYSKPPKAMLPGLETTELTVTLQFGKELKKNGSIGAVEATSPDPPRTRQ